MAVAHAARARATRSIRRPGSPVATLLPPQLRLLTPFMNITGAFALILGAVFSAYVFMPKVAGTGRSLLDPNQPGDEFLFNLLIAPVAITVNLVASLPGALRACRDRPDPQPRAGDSRRGRPRTIEVNGTRNSRKTSIETRKPAKRKRTPRNLPGLEQAGHPEAAEGVAGRGTKAADARSGSSPARGCGAGPANSARARPAATPRG